MDFIYIKIPASQLPPLRQYQIHDALERALAQRNLGSLAGWGASLAPPGGGGRRQAAFHRIDVEVTQLEPALALLRTELAALAVPLRSEIHYKRLGARMETWGPDGWSELAAPAPQPGWRG